MNDALRLIKREQTALENKATEAGIEYAGLKDMVCGRLRNISAGIDGLNADNARLKAEQEGVRKEYDAYRQKAFWFAKKIIGDKTRLQRAYAGVETACLDAAQSLHSGVRQGLTLDEQVSLIHPEKAYSILVSAFNEQITQYAVLVSECTLLERISEVSACSAIDMEKKYEQLCGSVKNIKTILMPYWSFDNEQAFDTTLEKEGHEAALSYAFECMAEGFGQVWAFANERVEHSRGLERKLKGAEQKVGEHDEELRQLRHLKDVFETQEQIAQWLDANGIVTSKQFMSLSPSEGLKYLQRICVEASQYFVQERDERIKLFEEFAEDVKAWLHAQSIDKYDVDIDRNPLCAIEAVKDACAELGFRYSKENGEIKERADKREAQLITLLQDANNRFVKVQHDRQALVNYAVEQERVKLAAQKRAYVLQRALEESEAELNHAEQEIETRTVIGNHFKKNFQAAQEKRVKAETAYSTFLKAQRQKIVEQEKMITDFEGLVVGVDTKGIVSRETVQGGNAETASFEQLINHVYSSLTEGTKADLERCTQQVVLCAQEKGVNETELSEILKVLSAKKPAGLWSKCKRESALAVTRAASAVLNAITSDTDMNRLMDRLKRVKSSTSLDYFCHLSW